MTPKEKAKEIINKFRDENYFYEESIIKNAKCLALICVENEYTSLRNQLFNLRSCGVIENPNTYLARLNQLIIEEQEVNKEIKNLC